MLERVNLTCRRRCGHRSRGRDVGARIGDERTGRRARHRSARSASHRIPPSASRWDDKPWSSNRLREAYAEAAEAFGWRRRHEMPKQDGVLVDRPRRVDGEHLLRAFPERGAGCGVTGDGSVVVEGSSNDIGTGTRRQSCLSPRRRWPWTLRWSRSAGATRICRRRTRLRQLAHHGHGRCCTPAPWMRAGSSLPTAPWRRDRSICSRLMRRANVSEVAGEGRFRVRR